MHEVIYKTVTTDGDSNVYQASIDNRPYREQLVTVKKVERINHLLRNLSKKLKTAAEITQSKIFIQRKHVFFKKKENNLIM